MLIIIEGADLCGKTTLAQALADETEGRVIHAAKPTKPPLREYDPQYEIGNGSLILDRFHWGERVWPYVFDRPSSFDWTLFRIVEQRLSAKGAIVVYAWREESILGPILEADPDEPIGAQGLRDAINLYEEVLWRTVLPTFGYNFEEQDMEAAVREIIRLGFLNEMEAMKCV